MKNSYSFCAEAGNSVIIPISNNGMKKDFF